jgi:predicted permease
MPWLGDLRRRFSVLLHRDRTNRELEEEMQFHLEMQAREIQEEGASADEAHHASRRRFGNQLLLEEASRAVWGWGPLERLAQDVRYAVRLLRLSPGFTAVAVLSLALGIGVNTAVFSLVDQLLLWSVPAREPSQLVSIEGGQSQSYPFYREFHDRSQAFCHMFAGSHPMAAGVRPESAAAVEVAQVSYVSGDYFETLGVGAAAGRLIVNSDDLKVGGSPVVVLSYGYWQRRFAGDLNVTGRKLVVNGYPLEIAGITERGFTGLFNGHPADAFLPLTMFPVTNPMVVRVWNTPNVSWLYPMARLKPAVSITQAQAGMRVLWPQVVDAVNVAMVKAGAKAQKYSKEGSITLAPGARGPNMGPNEMVDPLDALMIATGLVLLIACANVANLLLARANARRKEIAVRLAVGATRGRLIRQLLTESLVLAGIGGAIGLAVAYGGVLALAKAHIVEPEVRFRTSLAVAAFSAGVTVLTSILFGLVPAFRATRMELTEATKEGGAASPSQSRLRLGKALIAGQVALSLTLLVGAGLFLRTLRNLEAVDVGFERENVVIVDVDPASLGYRGHRLRTFYDELLERTRRIPGVRSAALTAMTPMGSSSRSRSFSAEGYQPKPGERMIALSNPVSPGYFTTLGVPMLLGRDFRPQDDPVVTPRDSIFAALGRITGGGGDNEEPSNASRICIINESLGRRLFGGASPLGHRLSYDDPFDPNNALEIVGVVKDVHQYSVRQADDHGIIYVPTWSDGADARWLAVRVAGSTAPVLTALRRELREIDRNVPVLHTTTLEEYFNANLYRERLIGYLSGFFGVLALGLASVGLYGVMAYAVARRTREVGIRMALGAQRGDVIRMIVSDSLLPVVAGVAVGLGAALTLTRLVAGMLYGVAPRDPVSMALATAAMLAVALLAAAIPARRASSVEPTQALHYE